jgi:CRISPR system Cascade subunit CasC
VGIPGAIDALESMADRIDAAYGAVAEAVEVMVVERGHGSLQTIADFAAASVGQG